MRGNYYSYLFKILLSFFLLLFVYPAQSQINNNGNIFHWDYTDEAIVTSDYSDNLKNLTDNNEETLYIIEGSNSMEVIFEFENPMYISGFLIYSGDVTKKVNINDVELAASNDKETWKTGSKDVDPDTQKSIKGEGGQVVRTNLENQGSFKYFRLKYTTTETNISLAELQLFGYPGVSSGNYPEDLIQVKIENQGTANEKAIGLNGIYSYSDPGIKGDSYIELASRAVDGLKNKYTVNGSSLWIQYDFDTDVVVKAFSIGVGATSNTDRNPRNFRLVASDNWGITWETIAEFNDFEFPVVNYANMKFEVPAARDYLYYRLEITKNNSGDMTHVSEIQFIGDKNTSIKKPITESPVNMYTQPGNLVIENKASQKLNCSIYSLSGALISSMKLNPSTTEMPLTGGVYIVKIGSQNGDKQSFKVLIK